MSRTLTRSHRRNQVALRAYTITQLSQVWQATYDVSDVRRSWAAFHREALPIIRESHGQSAALALDYFNAFREASGAPGTSAAVRAGGLDADRVRRALEFSAKVSVLRGISAGQSPAQAMQTGLTRTVGTATRLASEGGRETIIRSVRDDPAARGWQRVTGGSPCEFCAMLSARGGVYSRDGADFEAHDHCGCEAEPVYGRRELDERQQEWKRLYDEAAKGSRDPLKAFRAAYRERQSI